MTSTWRKDKGRRRIQILEISVVLSIMPTFFHLIKIPYVRQILSLHSVLAISLKPAMLHEHDEDANSGVVMVVPIKLGIKVKGRL